MFTDVARQVTRAGEGLGAAGVKARVAGLGVCWRSRSERSVGVVARCQRWRRTTAAESVGQEAASGGHDRIVSRSSRVIESIVVDVPSQRGKSVSDEILPRKRASVEWTCRAVVEHSAIEPIPEVLTRQVKGCQTVKEVIGIADMSCI